MAYQPVGAASLAASYSNLQNPGTNDCAPGTAPTFNTATGWTFNGTTQYLTTGYTPPNQAAFSMIARFSGGSLSGNRCIAGNSDGGSNQGLFNNLSLTGNTTFCANGNYSTNTAVASGVLAVAGGQAYLNGSTYGAAFTNYGAAWRVIYIGAYDSVGTAAFFFSGSIQALAIYNTTLTAGEVATLTTRMNALPVVPRGLPIIAAHYSAIFGG